MTDFDRRQRLITSTPHLTVEEIATRSFSKGVRGYAESEVRSFLKRVAEELANAQERERELSVAVDSLEEQLHLPGAQNLEALKNDHITVLEKLSTIEEKWLALQKEQEKVEKV